MRAIRPEKLNCPYAVVRFDKSIWLAENPEWYITIVSLFDDPLQAKSEVERLNSLNADKGCVYFVQRVKKYFRVKEPGRGMK